MILESKLYEIGDGGFLSIYGPDTNPRLALTLYYPMIDDRPELEDFERSELGESINFLNESMATAGFTPVAYHPPLRANLNSYTPAIVYEVEYDGGDKSLADWFKSLPCCKRTNSRLYFDGWEIWDFTTGDVVHEFVEWDVAGKYELDDEWDWEDDVMYEEYGDDIAGPDGMVYISDGVWLHRDHVGI